MKKYLLLSIAVTLGACLGGVSLAQEKVTKTPRRITVTLLTKLPKDTKENVVSALQLDKKHQIPNHFKSDQSMILALERAPKTIQDALAPYGYYNSSLKQTLTKQGNNWTVRYSISLGPQVILTQLKAPLPKGLPEKAKHDIQSQWPLKLNQPFLTTQYQEAKALLVNTARNYGYLDAQLTTHESIVDLNHHTAKVTLTLGLGGRYHFGKTHFNKSSDDDPNFLKRFIRYKAGDPYLFSELSLARNGFISSNYFDTVTLNPHPNKETHNVPISATLTPPVKRLYTVGLGFGTDTGVRGSLKTQFKRLNNRGHQASFYTRVSTINSAALLTYSIPGKYPPTDTYTISAQITQLDLNGTANSRELSITDHFVANHWSQSFSLSMLRETYDITATTINYPKTNTYLLTPSWDVERRYLNNSKNPSFGFHVSLHLTGAVKSLLSKTTFFQSNLKAAFMTRIFKHQRLIARGQLGYTYITNLGDLPLTQQLFAGGAESIRGFSYLSIGPGRILATASLELDQEIYPHYYFGLFTDVGNVGGSNIFHEKPKIGVGPAFVWDSPMGHVELSAGWAVSTPGHHPVLFQFSLGAMI